MRESAGPQSKQSGSHPNRRVMVLGVILLCVFVVWVATMIMGFGLGGQP
ncbi:MAG TPA: hypothetical protein VGR93_06310 [Candidatus Acidoferrales bacterium]|nr:hypothetical protein [Candidatus Acidoferrales bacterium]